MLRPRPLHHARGVALLAALLFPSYAAAQAATARLEGTIRDSVHARGAAGAVVFLTRTRPQPAIYRTAVADERGQYRLDSLAAGDYIVSFSADVLDSLELTMPPQPLVIGEGAHVRLDLATPSSATLRAGACPGIALPAGRGAVVGHVQRAESDSAVRGAVVAVTWQDLAVDRATLRPVVTPRGGMVRSDSLGQYRMCGLPTDVVLLMQVQHEGRATSAVRVVIPDSVGVVLQHFSFSEAGSRTLAALDSSAADSTPKLSGKALLTGLVRSAGGQPLSQALVRVVDAATPAATTDSLGQFSLSGLPSGTQMLDVRHVGYLLTQVPVNLRDGATTSQIVTLTRIVSLDSVRVLAQRTRYRQFEDHAKHNGFGRFLREADLDRQYALETSDYLRGAGYFIQGTGLDAKVVTSRASGFSFRGPCEMNVVIDGIQHQDINLVSPRDVGAMEIYRGPAGAPVEYDSACGVVVIWTKR